jgi:hypothetical protein
MKIQPPFLALAILFGFGIASAHSASFDAKAKAEQIDSLVAADLAKHQQKPNAPAAEGVFLRRLYLDVIGRVPTKKETTDFLASQEPNKREAVIDTLLASDGYVAGFYNFWADVLRMKTNPYAGGQSAPAGFAWERWMKGALRDNKPYDVMVRELLTASGKSYENGAMGFYIRDYNMPLDNMAVTTQVFLGTSMVCAQCHNHPFDKWTQMDYYQMAAHTNGMVASNGLSNPLLAEAFYGRKPAAAKQGKGKGAGAPVLDKSILGDLSRKDAARAMVEILRPLRYNTVLEKKVPLTLPSDYKYPDAKPKAIIEPTIPAAFSKDGKIVQKAQMPERAYADWMTSKDNPRFTTVIANRLWKKLFGAGVIDPVDEITDSTVPSNPALMTLLEATMKDLNYDMKAYLRVLLNSKTYQAAAYAKDLELGEQFHFPGPLVRRMTAEQVWDSMVALYKPGADVPSRSHVIETEVTLRRIEWLDRALNALSPQELAAAAKEVSETQAKLASDVRNAQQQLTLANKAHDETAIRAAKKTVAQQRKNIDAAVEKVVFTTGFKKFAQMAREGKLKEQVEDQEFAQEIQAVLKAKGGQDLEIDDALAVLAKQQRGKYAASLATRAKADAEKLAVDTNPESAQLKIWEQNRDTLVVRANDLRSPAPNGHFLREFGQSDRELIENSNDEATVGQSLMMLNGKYFKWLANPYSIISRQLNTAKTDADAIDTIYLSLLSRRATAQEQAVLAPVIAGHGAQGRREALWAVLNTRQFLFVE